MASVDLGPDSNSISKLANSHEAIISQRLNANHVDLDPSMETRSISEENERNSNVSPSKGSDPTRKKTFKIISVKKGGTGSGDLVTDNDADSVDGLDESQTEDLSSEFYDSSKATDLDVDVQDTPLTPDEVTSTTTIVMKQKPDQNSQSRFKVVKIETKEPFRRGKWVCYDFFDTAPAAVVTLNGSKATEDSIIQSALSGTLSSSPSVHYVHDVNESSSNLFVAPVVALSPSSVPGQPILTDMFFPIQPAPASQVQSNIDGSPTVVTQYPQPIHMSVAGGPSSNSSFHSLAQSGGTTIVQSLPHTNVFPYAQNGPSSTFLNGNPVEKTSQSVIMPNSSLASVSGSGQSMPPSMVTIPSVTDGLSGAVGPSQPFTVTSPGSVASSQTPIQQLLHRGGVPAEVGGGMIVEDGQAGTVGGTLLGSVGQAPAGISVINPEDSKPGSSSLADQMGPGMDESMSSVKTLEPGDAQDPSKLEEAVETMYIGLEGNEEDNDDERTCGQPQQVMRPKDWPEQFPPMSAISHMDSPGCGTCLVCTPIGSACPSPVLSPLTIIPPPGPANATGSPFIDPNFVAAAYSSVSTPQSAFVGMSAGVPGNGGPLPSFLVTSSAGDFFLPTVPPLSMAGAVAFPGIPGPSPASFYAPASAMFAPLPSMYSGLSSAFTAPIAMPSQGTPQTYEAESLPCLHQTHAQRSPQPQTPDASGASFQTSQAHESSAGSSYQHHGTAQDRSPSPAISSGGPHASQVPMGVVSSQPELSTVSATISSDYESLSTCANKRATPAALPLEANQCTASGTSPSEISNDGNSSSSICNNNNNNICDLFDPQQGKHQPQAAAPQTDREEEGYVDC